MTETPTLTTAEGATPINGKMKLGDCYLEVLKCYLDATKKKGDDPIRDALVITKLVGKTSNFVRKSNIKFWIEIDRL